MDLMLGGDLKFHLINAGRFTEKRARFYAAEVLLGLEHVHNASIIYRSVLLHCTTASHHCITSLHTPLHCSAVSCALPSPLLCCCGVFVLSEVWLLACGWFFAVCCLLVVCFVLLVVLCVVCLCLCVCSVLCCLVVCGVVGWCCSDMKLENVLLDHLGHCRISDLGLAVVTKTKIKGYAGTPGYTAPEMIKNKLYGPSADIFSFGVMLYRMLCGSKPFKGKIDRDLDKAVVDRKPQFPKEIFSKDAISLLTGVCVCVCVCTSMHTLPPTPLPSTALWLFGSRS